MVMMIIMVIEPLPLRGIMMIVIIESGWCGDDDDDYYNSYDDVMVFR